jgi:GT2 family glycosyltransferase
MEKNNLKILTIIVTYNGSKWIKKCIDSIQVSNMDTDIFVVDNASIDETVFILESYPTLILHKSKYNLGFGQANNLGLKHALKNKYDYVFLLNQDTWIEKNTIEILLTVAEKNKEYGIISPMHYFSDEISLEYNFSVQLSPWFCKNIVSDFVLKEFKEMQDIYSLNFVNAAAWLVPKKTLEVIGGFDPLFFHYGEDNNYCNRLKYHGLKIGIVPEVKIYHDCLDANNIKDQSTKEQLRKFEIESKAKLANINIKINRKSITLIVSKLFIIGVIKLLSLNLKNSKVYFLKAILIFKNCNRILKSRKNNLMSKSNYL